MIVPGSASPLLTTTENGGYTIAKSLRFRSSASAYLSRTPASAGNRKTWTWSAWIKRGSLPGNFYLMSTGGSYTDTGFMGIGLVDTGSGQAANFNLTTGTQVFRRSNALYRDPSAWYHLIVSFDTTQSTAANRVKMYVNGVELTSFAISNDPTQNTDYGFNQGSVASFIARNTVSSDSYFDGYIADQYFIDGQALTPLSFGETDATTGVWKPKAYSGTYGTNGFYLKFTDVATTSGSNAGLGKDFSGNGNYWNTNNISVTSGATYDSMKDVPTLTDTDTANFCTINPLNTQSNLSVTNGNLQCVGSTANWRSSVGTIGSTSGKYYWETTLTSGSQLMVGFAKSSFAGTTDNQYVGQTSDSYAYYTDTGGVYNTGSSTAYGATCAAGDIIGVALDLDNGKAYFSKNGTWQNSGNPASQTNPAFTSLSGTFLPGLGMYSTTGAVINFGQRPFTYTPPTGFKALNTYNLPDSTIVAGNKVMDATLYTGNNTTNVISNAGSFKPDLVWIKGRSNTGQNTLQDSVRGANKYLISNSTAAEGADGSVTSFNSGGFSLTTDAGVSYNASGVSYVGWQWQAGQGTTSSNTSGSITSTVSVNASAGFSIVSWTSNGSNSLSTMGHGLGVSPSFIIIRRRDSTGGDWRVYHKNLSVPNDRFLKLQSLDAEQNPGKTVWSTSSTTFGAWQSDIASNGNACIAYCWAEIAGFSKFGSYTGNLSTDGPFVYLGFKPKYIMFKNITTGSNQWEVYDTTRDKFNSTGTYLLPAVSDAEGTFGTTNRFDYLSNGFKVRNTGGSINGSGETIIYAAFAENPFKNALAR